jgi:hypothetical protein
MTSRPKAGGGVNEFVTTVLKRDDGVKGVKIYQKLRDVIYGRPLATDNGK